jgi:PleD family two-component response regulator
VIPSAEGSPEKLAEMADQLLYRAKRTGRNRVQDATVPAL